MFRCVLAWILALTGAGVVRSEEAAPVKVPFDTLASRHIVVSARINGKGPYRFIFDTGAPTSLVSQKVAREAGVVDAKSGGLMGAFFGAYGQKKIRSVTVGALTQDNVDVVVMDHPIVVAIAKTLDQPIEGILGMNLFGRYRMTIDYQARTVAFVPGTFVPVDLMQVMMTLLMPSIDEMQRAAVIGPRGLLGVRVTKKAGDEEAGVSIEEVYGGSPAARAGLKTGDRLLALDGRWTEQVSDCFEAARHFRPGGRVSAEIVRDGKKQVVIVETSSGF